MLQKKICQDIATKKGIWIKDNDKYQLKEFGDNNKPCKSMTYLAPDFSSPVLFKSVASGKKRPQTTVSGWWAKKPKTFYPVKYFVNRFGYKQKINTDDIVKKIEAVENSDEESYAEHYAALNSLGEKYLGYEKVLLSSAEIDNIKSGADIVGDTIYIDNVGNNIRYNDQIAWVDIKGNKNIYANSEIFSKRNKISCPSEIKDVTSDEWSSVAGNNNITNVAYKCLYMENTTYDNLKTAQEELNDYVDKVEDHISKIEDIDSRLRTELLKLQKDIRTDIDNINKDIDETTRLRMLKDTAKGKTSVTKLTMESNKMQLKMWLVISLLLLIYAMNNIRGEIVVSNFNIFMLISCVVILFFLARRLYIARVI